MFLEETIAGKVYVIAAIAEAMPNHLVVEINAV
jgi:hypothetical protein